MNDGRAERAPSGSSVSIPAGQASIILLLRLVSRLAVVVVLAMGSGNVAAQATRTAFRPCIDPSNLPFANEKGEGFENRIAELFAGKLGLPVQNYALPQRMNFIRNTLRYRLPGQDFRCDIVMSVPAHYDQASATAPYYRSTYVLVYPKGKGLDQVRTGSDLFALPPDLPIYVDDRLMELPWVILGSGSRSSKIKIAPEVFRRLPSTTIVPGLAVDAPR